ncbi:MAG: hypothetical protein Q9193_005785 [Seirophora villosa]
MEKPTRPPEIGNVDRSGGILATSILALTLVIIFIALRFATRIWLVKRLGWDDWCIVFAGLGHMVGMGLITVQINAGFGRPAYYLTEQQLQVFMKFSYGEWLQAWNTKMPGKCFSKGQLERIIISQASQYAPFDRHNPAHNTVISIISDFFLSAFPILILRKVKISFRSKVGLCLLMGLGVM